MSSLEDLPEQTRDDLALLARRLSENPKTRKDFLRLAKVEHPDATIPEIELQDRLAEHEKKQQEKIAQLEAKLLEKEQLEELEKRRRNLVTKGKIKEDEISEVEKVMLEKGIANHDTAAEYMNWMKQAAAPTPSTFNANVIDPSTRSTLSAYWKNPQMTARNEAQKALSEIRRNPKPVGL